MSDRIEQELAIRDAVADEALAILREATGRTDYHNIVEAAREAARMLAETPPDTARFDRLEALPGIEFTYRPEDVAATGPTLRSEIDCFLARLDEGK